MNTPIHSRSGQNLPALSKERFFRRVNTPAHSRSREKREVPQVLPVCSAVPFKIAVGPSGQTDQRLVPRPRDHGLGRRGASLQDTAAGLQQLHDPIHVVDAAAPNAAAGLLKRSPQAGIGGHQTLTACRV